MGGKDFDDLPRFRDPIAQPCGCALRGREGINMRGTHTEWRDIHNVLCPLHAAAPDLLEALRLYDVWQATPTDRGGKDGTKGRAFAAFIAAKDAALAKAKAG